MFELSFLYFQWLFPIVVTLHNLEEAIWLPAWSQTAGKWHAKVGKREFRFAVLVLTVLAYGLTYLSWSNGPESVWSYLNCGYILAMLLNVFLPHVAATIALRQPCPGVWTAVACNLPINLLLLYLAFHDQWITGKTFLIFAPFTVAGIALSIPLLFFVGKQLPTCKRRNSSRSC
ncbi:HXXEE domain-containing protein [Laceyella tengchongensis]|uniref:HXXEE domain-containing protein n=1 Tax=Laceyella tengchongensis TaxID=574699 RepID=UPI00188EBB7B